MAGDKKVAQSEPLAAGLKSDTRSKLADQNVASRKVRMSDTTLPYLEEAVSTVKAETDKKSVAETGAQYPHTSCYDYHYPGYSGSFSQVDDHGYLNAGGGSYTGIQSDNGSPLYYLPSYNPYATGTFLGADGQQPYYPQQSVYGYSTYGTRKSGMNSNGSVKSNGCNSKKTNTYSGRTSNFPIDMRLPQPTASSNISKSILQAQRVKSLNQSGSFARGFQPAGNFSSFTNQNQSLYACNYSLNYTSNARVWNENDRFKVREKSYTNGGSESSAELTRGPRAHNKPLSSNEDGKPARGDQYNLEEFQIKYDYAKFYVIKSYSEDDVHKCIKYAVWSSTPNGNKKLDSVFHDAEGKSSEVGKKCPVFLFFSVNGSGQFVGVAEMIGRVDFEKNMEFWQLDKWSGFFPVKWHIIKDIPNSQLRYIILENNDNRPVTYTRDTQEIGLEQGLEMLNIFKSYSAKTFLLDDFNFYENREMQLKAKRSSKAALQPEIYQKNDFPKNVKSGERILGEGSMTIDGSSTQPSLVDLTRNLTLNANSPRTNAIASSG